MRGTTTYVCEKVCAKTVTTRFVFFSQHAKTVTSSSSRHSFSQKMLGGGVDSAAVAIQLSLLSPRLCVLKVAQPTSSGAAMLAVDAFDRVRTSICRTDVVATSRQLQCVMVTGGPLNAAFGLAPVAHERAACKQIHARARCFGFPTS